MTLPMKTKTAKNLVKQPPYTVAQVLAQLHTFAGQLKAHPPNLTGGPGYVHQQVLDILDRGISANGNAQ